MDVASRLMEQLDGWSFEQGHLAKSYYFPDFATALAFVNRIGAIAEEQSHHPDVYMTWGKVSLEVWTHKIDGLTESDFILAAKFDEVPVPKQDRPASRGGDDDAEDGEDDAAGGFDDGGADAFDNEEDFDESDRE
jgi:4a-hydroxytetrahydrobiopterin dehydratase